jgi:hypothetical protein
MAFSSSEAAFEGFRLTRERPALVVALTIFQLVASALMVPVMVGLLGPDLDAMKAQRGAEPTDLAGVMAVIEPVARIDAVLFPVALVLISVISCAIYRAVLRPERSRLGGVQFAADELRMLLLVVVLNLLWFAAVFGAGLGTGIVLAVLQAIAGGNADALAPPLIILVTIVVSIWFWVRFSLAAPMTFAERRIRVFPSWTMTRGRFWALFGAYVLAFALSLLVAFLGLAVYVGIAAVVGGGVSAAGQVSNPDFSSLSAYLTPVQVIYMIVSAIFYALTYVIVIAPAAVAYRDLPRAP